MLLVLWLGRWEWCRCRVSCLFWRGMRVCVDGMCMRAYYLDLVRCVYLHKCLFRSGAGLGGVGSALDGLVAQCVVHFVEL